MSDEINPIATSLKFGKALIVVLGLTLAGTIGYKYYTNSDLGGGLSIPKEMQINYIPSDFKTNINSEEALKILANPSRYRKEFNQLVYNLNISILNHVANRMDLSENIKGQIVDEYEKHHPYLRNLYFHDFVALKDTSAGLYQTWYDNEGANSVAILYEVASKYTCFLVNHVITTLIETQEGKIYGKGKKVDTPCGIALTEGLKPLMDRMEERAAVQDFSRSRGLLQEKVERVIAELATMEVTDKKGINKQLQTKVWGFNVSSSDIEVSAISILKVGFRLNEYFDINLDQKNNIVSITLPQPVILSHEVYPKIDKLDIGWLREVKSIDLNKNFNVLRAEFRREALESNIMDDSKQRAVELMNTMFGPLINSINSQYTLRVKFQEGEKDIDLDASPSDNWN